MPPERATRFSLHQNFATGGSRKLGLKGTDGVVKYHWPLSALSIDWIREHWGGGAFQANWLVLDDGKLLPRGRSRVVELDSAPSYLNGQAPPSVPYAKHIGYVVRPEPTQQAPAPAPAMPAEVVDMRVRAAEEIANLRIQTQRELFREQLDWQRQMADERYQRLEARIDEIAQSPRDSYDDDEPDPWAWLKELAQQLQPTLKVVLPEILKRFGATAALPPGKG